MSLKELQGPLPGVGKRALDRKTTRQRQGGQAVSLEEYVGHLLPMVSNNE
jgi:hypothetical protein